jgi:hypothetical protein
MKPQFIVLPLWMLAGAALAQEAAPPPEPPAAPVAEASAAPAVQPKRRQGAYMRHCLNLKESKAIIRCAVHGRKP